jgi:perosamine synthetase
MSTAIRTRLDVPFFRPTITRDEIDEVVACLRSGWLTSGPRTQEFEERFARFVGSEHAVAVNSCTAALHLAVEAKGLRPGQGVLVPTMTFAATAEIVRHHGAVPVLVDCDPVTLNLDLCDAESKLNKRTAGGSLAHDLEIVGMIPVHVGGLMADIAAVKSIAKRHGLWVVEDAAHAFPAAFRPSADHSWQWCGENTAAITCFSFYANKTITTGEGGMAVTNNRELAERMKCMSLHGLTHDAWSRYKGNGRGSWDYRILEPGYKCNMTDIAAAIGIQQLRRCEDLRRERQAVAEFYREAFCDLEQLELPDFPLDRIHAWHLFPVRLRLHKLSINRNDFLEALRDRGVGCSVHWRPLHLHPYYAQTFGWNPQDLPVATSVWQRLVSLPLFPSMRVDEQEYVVQTVREICHRYASDKSRGGNGRPKPR